MAEAEAELERVTAGAGSAASGLVEQFGATLLFGYG